MISIVKTIVRRRRPVYNVDDMKGSLTAIDQFSFPSGHTTRVVTLAFFIIRQLRPSLAWSVTVAAWAAIVAMSRIMLGRHHVLDVMCGIVIGTAQYRLVEYMWLSPDMVVRLLQPLHEELHL